MHMLTPRMSGALFVAGHFFFVNPGWSAGPHHHPGGAPYDLQATFCDPAGRESARDGPWSDPGTWQGGRTPESNERVVIRHSVRQDGHHSAAQVCVLAPGALVFEPGASTRLAAETLVITGRLEIGRADAPIGSSHTAELVIRDAPFDLRRDPDQWGTGVLILDHGQLVTHGGRKPTPFARLAREPAAGDLHLELAEAVEDWRPGDRLVIPDSRQLRRNEAGGNRYVSQTEYVEVAAVAGTTVALTTPLQYNHPGARNPDGTLVRLPHAAHLTRNAIIRSENPDGTRGHVLAHHRAWIDVRGSGFYSLGRTRALDPLDNTRWEHGVPVHIGENQIGRYPLHLHHLYGPRDLPEDTPQFRIAHSAFVDNRKWGIAIHQSSFGEVTGNVVARSEGAGIATEDGNEYQNLIAGNFVADSLGSFRHITARSGIGDFGHEGSCYWFHSAQSIYRDNIGAACGAWGLVVASIGHLDDRVPLFPGADLTNPDEHVIASYNNDPSRVERVEVYGASERGVVFFHTGSPANRAVGVMEDVAVWHVHDRPVYIYGHLVSEVRDVWIRGDASALADETEIPDGLLLDHKLYAHATTVERADVRGVRVGLRLPARDAEVRDSRFENWINWSTQELNFRKVVAQSYRFARVEFRRLPGAPSHFRVHTLFDYPKPHRKMTGIALTKAALTSTHFVFENATFDGVSHGSALRLYTRWQDPARIIPGTGLSNAAASAQYGVSVADALAACTSAPTWLDAYLCPVPATGLQPPPTVTQRSASATTDAEYRLSYDIRATPMAEGRRVNETVRLTPGLNWITRDVPMPDGSLRRWSALVELREAN